MVIERDDQHHRQIVITPNRSMNWSGNLKFIGAIFLVLFTTSVGFCLAGAWMVFPFAGLEVVAVASALYYTSWKLSICEVIQIEDDQLIVGRGFKRIENQWRFPLDDVRISVRAGGHPWDPLYIIIYSPRSSGHVELGKFLSRDETQQLLKALRQAKLPVAEYSQHGFNEF